MKRPDTCNVPIIMCWRGKIMIYSGSVIIGQKMLKEALQRDPDCSEAMKALKMVKVATQYKEEAGDLFKKEQLDAAIEKFD